MSPTKFSWFLHPLDKASTKHSPRGPYVYLLLNSVEEQYSNTQPLLNPLPTGRVRPSHLNFLLLLTRPGKSRAAPKGVGPGPTLAWTGWKQPDIPVEVDTDRLETSRREAAVLKKLSLAGIAKLSRLKYS